MRPKKKRTFSPEYTCTKLFTSLTVTFPKLARVYSTRQSPGVKKLLGPAAILPHYIKTIMALKIAGITEQTKNWEKKISDFRETLAPAAILPKLYPNHYEMSLKKIRKSEEEKVINFVKLRNITLKID